MTAAAARVRSRRRAGVIPVILAAQAATVAGFGAAQGNRRVIAYLIVWSLLVSLAVAGHRRWPLPRVTLYAMTGAAGLHLAGGLMPSPDPGAPMLYETWLVEGVLKFDQVAHAIISGIVTVALFQILGSMIDPTRAGRGTRAAIALLACWGFGAANELLEFLSSLRFADAYVGGLENAGWDLAFNTAGSAIAAVSCVAGVSALRLPNRGVSAHT